MDLKRRGITRLYLQAIQRGRKSKKKLRSEKLPMKSYDESSLAAQIATYASERKF
jgi:hypothetical protein